MKKFNEVKTLLNEEQKETLMEIGWNFLQAKKEGDSA